MILSSSMTEQVDVTNSNTNVYLRNLEQLYDLIPLKNSNEPNNGYIADISLRGAMEQCFVNGQCNLIVRSSTATETTGGAGYKYNKSPVSLVDNEYNNVYALNRDRELSTDKKCSWVKPALIGAGVVAVVALIITLVMRRRK